MTDNNNNNIDATTIRGSLLQIDDEPAEPQPNVVAIEVGEGESPHIVGGAPGWYSGDRAYRTCDGRYEKNDKGEKAGNGPAIKGDATRSAAEIARERFKLNGPYKKVPVFVPVREFESMDDLADHASQPGANGGVIAVPKHFLIRHEPTGIITSKHSVSDKYQLGNPKDMNVIDMFSGEITRGGSMKNESVTYLSSAQETWEMPDGQKVREFVSVFKDWSGVSADRIVRHKSALECRNIIRSALGNSQRVWRFDHTRTGQAQLKLFEAIAKQVGREAARGKLLLQGWGKTKVTEKQLIQLFKDSLPKKKDDDGKPTDELTSKSERRFERLMDHMYHADGASTQGGLTIWSAQQAASFDATHMFSKVTGLEGMEFGSAGRFMDTFTRHANNLFVSENYKVTKDEDEKIFQAVQLVVS